MYSDNYEEDDEKEETSSSGGGIRDFYNNNKKLVLVLIGIVVFILLALLLTKGGSNNGGGSTNTKTEITYKNEEMAAVSMQVNSSYTLEVKIENKAKNGKVLWESNDKEIVETGKDNDGKVLITSHKKLGTAIVKASYMVDDKLIDSVDFSVTVYEGKEDIKLQTILFPDQDLMLNKVIPSFDLGNKLTYFPAEGYITNKEFISSDPNIVVVDSDGNVTPVGLGNATITAKVNDLEAVMNVYVLENVVSPGLLKNPEEVKFTSSLISMKKEEIVTLVPELTPNNAATDYLTWSSDNPSVVRIEKDGNISALSVGSATVTVKAINGNEAKVLVEVLDNIIKVESIAFSPSTLTLEEGESYSITPVITPSDATNKGLSYTSSNPAVASYVSTEGGVSVSIVAHSKGTAVITATSIDGPTKDITVTVTKTSSSSSSTPGSTSSNPYDNKGYKISSTGGNVSRSYEATINNPLKEGVTSQVITFTITKSSTKKLKVCTYQYNGTECNVNSGKEITSSGQITLSTKGTWVIKVVEFDGDGKELKDPLYWYTLVDKGSGTATTPTSTPTITCPSSVEKGKTDTCSISNGYLNGGASSNDKNCISIVGNGTSSITIKGVGNNNCTAQIFGQVSGQTVMSGYVKVTGSGTGTTGQPSDNQPKPSVTPISLECPKISKMVYLGYERKISKPCPDGSILTGGTTVATNAGTYRYMCKANEGYEFSNNGNPTDTCEVKWSIDKSKTGHNATGYFYYDENGKASPWRELSEKETFTMYEYNSPDDPPCGTKKIDSATKGQMVWVKFVLEGNDNYYGSEYCISSTIRR